MAQLYAPDGSLPSPRWRLDQAAARRVPERVNQSQGRRDPVNAIH